MYNSKAADDHGAWPGAAPSGEAMSQPHPGQTQAPGPPSVDTNEVRGVKDALAVDITDFGVGIYHLPTNRVSLRPASHTKPVGHAALVNAVGLNTIECRGFVITQDLATREFVIENMSGLNVGTGGVGMGMPEPLFDSIRQAILAAGL